MRALANPSRLALLDLLRDDPATATECGAVIGESPSACSYHLRALAKWGLIEEVPSKDGRERRWRATTREIRSSSVPEHPNGPEAIASALLRQASLERDAQVLAEFFENESTYDRAWQNAATFISAAIRTTPAQLEELREKILELLKPFDVSTDEADEDSERVHMVIRGIPERRP